MEIKRTIIQRYSTAIVSGLDEKIRSLAPLKHNLTKGELRELFVNEVLTYFLTDQFGIGSGIIINQCGHQSNQNDIIIYDNRVLPPFIKKQNIGVYPVESVLGVIEVKTKLSRLSLNKTESSFKKLKTEICNPKYSFYNTKGYNPICGIIGFYGNGPREIGDTNGLPWIKRNMRYLTAICLVKKYSWLKVTRKGEKWSISNHDPQTFEETKRFLAAFLDNIRTISNRRPYRLDSNHKDWLSIYLRDQTGIIEHFKEKLKEE